MKTNKKLMLIGLCAATCFGVGFANVGVASADNSGTVTVVAPASFTTLDNASIRLGDADTTAIRFAASISASDYAEFIKTYGEDNVEFGMCIARTSSVDKLLTYDVEDTAFPMEYWMSDYNPSDDTATEYRYCFAIHGIDAANFNRYYTALAYAKVMTTDTTNPVQYVYSSYNAGETTRTPFQVAVGSKLLGWENETSNGIIDSVMASAGDSLAFGDSSYDCVVGEEKVLSATVATAHEGNVTIAAEYSSANDSIAKIVTEEGSTEAKVVGVGVGSTTITATVKGSDGNSWTKDITVTIGKGTVTPTFADGVVTLNTNGEATTLSLYSGDTELDTVSLSAGTLTYDVREMAISAMENNGITEATALTVKVDSVSATGEVATETYVPITASNFVDTCDDVFSVSDNVEGKYFFLTENVTVKTADWSWYAGQHSAYRVLYGDLDGRGYSIILNAASSHSSYEYAGLAHLFYMNWKNVVFESTATIASTAKGCVGFFGYQTFGSFENCYFKMNINSNLANDIYFILSNRSTFSNCIIELNDLNTADEYNLYYLGSDSNGATKLNDVVIISSASSTKMLGVTHAGVLGAISFTNVYQYNSIRAFMTGASGYDFSSKTSLTETTGKKYSNWSSAWTITENEIKLCEKAVVSTTVTPTIADGVVTLNTQGEATKLSLYSGDTEVTSVQLPAGTYTYDVRDLAISYMEKNSITDSMAFTVKVESATYAGVSEATTETFVAITQSNFYTAFNSTYATSANATGKYFFLTENVSLASSSQFRQNSYIGNACTFTHMYCNLDGRGYSITVDGADATTSGAYGGIVGNFAAKWKNVVINSTVTLNSAKSTVGVFAYVVSGSFENCYFNLNITNNTGAVAYFSVSNKGTYNNCIVNLNDVNNTDDYNLYFSGSDAMGTYNNLVIITNNTPSVDMFHQNRTGWMTMSNVYQYTSIGAFVKGETGYDQSAKTSITETTGKKYSDWSSAWTITETSIALCGNTVKTIS